MNTLSENWKIILLAVIALFAGFKIVQTVSRNRIRYKQKGIVANGDVINGNKSLTTINNYSEGPRQSNGKNGTDDIAKIKTRILFIDDNHADYKMVSILKTAGWANTKSIKDVSDLDDPKVIEADIIFVDINGVGTKLFQDQGLGLASALKKKYSNKKIVLYSAESKGDRFHSSIREVDGCLNKDAEPYQFIHLIESFSQKK